MGIVLLPHFSRGAADEEGIEKMFPEAKAILARMGILLCGATLLLMAGAGPLLDFLFASTASPGVWAVRMLAAVYLIEAFKCVIDPLLIALGMWKPLARLEA